MDKAQFDAQLKKLKKDQARIAEIDTQVLAALEKLHPLIQERVEITPTATHQASILRRVSNQKLRFGIAVRNDEDWLPCARGDEYVAALYARYAERQADGYATSLDALRKPLARIMREERRDPGKQYDSAGKEISDKKQNIRVPAGDMASDIQELQRQFDRTQK